MNLRTLILIIISVVLISGCKIKQAKAVDQGFANLDGLKGEWDVRSKIKIAFDIFEESEGEVEMELSEDGQALIEKYEGYYHDTKWNVKTVYNMQEEDSIEVTVEDSEAIDPQQFSGSYQDGMFSAMRSDKQRKLEMQFTEEGFIKKIFEKDFKGEWELVLHWDYRRD